MPFAQILDLNLQLLILAGRFAQIQPYDIYLALMAFVF
jgi:hypothetical protein